MINTTSTTIQSLIADLNYFNTEIVHHIGVLAYEEHKGETVSMDVIIQAERMILLHSHSMQRVMCNLLELRHAAVPTIDRNKYGVNLFKAVAI